ncbi:hypothetical protein J3302_003977 [Escherichia coli]|nr:hypothetical protein [Escherichia coli]
MSKNKKNIKNKAIKKDLNLNDKQSKMESMGKGEIKIAVACLLVFLFFAIPIFADKLTDRKYDNQITYNVVDERNLENILKNNRFFLDLEFNDEQYASAIKKSNLDFINLSLEIRKIQLNSDECSYGDETCKNKVKSDRLALVMKIQKWSDDRVNLGVVWLSKNKSKEENEIERNDKGE